MDLGFIADIVFGNPEVAQSFLGAFLGAISSLAGAFGGGGGNDAALAAADQRSKLQAATQRANVAAQNKQRADEVAVGAARNSGEKEIDALGQLVSGFRQTLLNNIRR